jgi:hypothetical protein
MRGLEKRFQRGVAQQEFAGWSCEEFDSTSNYILGVFLGGEFFFFFPVRFFYGSSF